MVNIVGIGNALVDTEFQLSEQQLLATGLTKGNMTLASHQEQHELLDFLAKENIFPSKLASGGSAANSIFAMASLGSRPYYACRVGDDKFGDFYLADLDKVGIITSKKSIAQAQTTGSCVVLVTPDGERTMQTYLGTSAEISEQDIDFEPLKQADWLYLEGYLAMSPSVQPAITQLKAHAKQHHTKIAVSFADPAVVKFGREGLENFLVGGVDVIFCNREEACLFTGEDDYHQASLALLQFSKMAVVTNGSKETAIAYQTDTHENILQLTPTPVVTDVLDCNGAGDNFAGAFLYALSKNYDLTTCSHLASQVAGQVIRQFGARLSPETYQQIYQNVVSA